MMTGGTLQTEIDGLIRNLSICSGTAKCEDCQMMQEGCNFTRLAFRAIGAIGGLQQIADHYEQTSKDYWKEACEYKAQLPKHGEWLEKQVIHDRADAKITDWQHAKCSVCGKWHTTPYLYSFTHYESCPHCGAIMDLGDE